MSFFFLYFSLLLYIKKSFSNIIIPFKIKNNPVNKIESNQENSFIHNYLFNTYYSKIEVGTPKQIIEVQISCQKNGISLKEGSCLSSEYYNKKYSSSIIEKTHCTNQQNLFSFYQEININETISFPFSNNLLNSNSKINIKDFPLIYFKQLSEKEINLIKIYGRKIYLYEDLLEELYSMNKNSSILENNKDGKACLLIGMSLSTIYSCLPNNNFISYMHKNNFIKDSNWGIKFYNNEKEKNNYDGEFIIGSLPHEYSPDNYKKEQYFITNALYYKNSYYWQIYFNEIYFLPLNSKISLGNFNKDTLENKEIIKNKINVGIDSNAQFDFDIKVIFGTKKYFEAINEHFFSKYKDICEFNIEEKRYGIFKCDKSLNIEMFPTLYFFHKIYNYTYELNYKDLFEDIGDKKYFRIVFDETEDNLWKLGTIFFKKYFFIFNTEEKLIGFYNNKIDVNVNINNIWNTKYFNNMIWVIFIVLAGVGGFFLGKKIYSKIRAKRLNELNDNFIYNSKNQILEMSSKK